MDFSSSFIMSSLCSNTGLSERKMTKLEIALYLFQWWGLLLLLLVFHFTSQELAIPKGNKREVKGLFTTETHLVCFSNSNSLEILLSFQTLPSFSRTFSSQQHAPFCSQNIKQTSFIKKSNRSKIQNIFKNFSWVCGKHFNSQF